MLVVVAVAVAVVVAGLVARFVIADDRGYSSSHGTTIVHYTLARALLGRDLSEMAVIPPGGGARPLLVLLHGRHDPSPFGWLVPQRSGPESMLSDALLASIAKLDSRAPVVVLLNGGAHSYYHDRRDGAWGSMILKEAIPDAIRRFQAKPGRVAIGGISMGGYGALYLASVTPGGFCAVGGHSAASGAAEGRALPALSTTRRTSLGTTSSPDPQSYPLPLAVELSESRTSRAAARSSRPQVA